MAHADPEIGRGLSLREFLAANRNWAITGALVVLALALTLVIVQSFGGPRVVKVDAAYYIDSVTNELFTDSADRFPPIQSPAGNPAYRVYLFSFTDCSNDNERVIAYYEKFSEQARQQLVKRAGAGLSIDDDPAYLEIAREGLLYSVDGENWQPSHDREITRIIDERIYRDGRFADPCHAP